MISVAELLTDTDFAAPFDLIRSTGSFDNEGEFTQTAGAPIRLVGVIQPASQADLVNFVPEGERSGQMIVAYCKEEIIVSDGETRQSDIIVWHGTQYRVVKSLQWQDHGYWQAWAEGAKNG